MKTILSRNQYQDDQIAGIVDSLIFGHLQRKQYSKTLNALLSESPHLMKDATTMPNAPNQICLNVNSFLHDQNLEQIIATFYTYGRFDMSPNLLELGKKLRDLTNEFSTELAFGCHSYSNNEQRLYGRKLRSRTQHTPTMRSNQIHFNNQLDANKRVEYSMEQVPQTANESAHHNDLQLHYSQAIESHEPRVEDSSSHENAQHSRRKAAQLKQTQRAKHHLVEDLVKLSNDNLRDKDVGVDNSSFLIDPFLEVENFNEILKSVVGDDEETLFETLETFEREEAMEADQNSRDSLNQSGGNAALALDVPMHEDVDQSTPSPLSRQHPSFSSHSHNTFSMPLSLPQPQHLVSHPIGRPIHRPLMEQYIQHPSMSNPMESRAHNASFLASMPPPPPPNPPTVDSHPKIGVKESEKKSSRVVDARESSWIKNAPPPPPPPPPPPSVPRTRVPSSSSSHTPSPSCPLSSTSSSLGITPKLSSLGRIPKKGQSITPFILAPSPSASPRNTNVIPVVESKIADGFRISKGKIAPLMNGNDGRRDSMDSQDTLRAESVGESDCTMTENEDNDQPSRKESTKSEKEKKNNWDDLFEDSPSTADESSREKDKMKELQENKRRAEMKELEKKREREKRRKDKEKKEEDRRDRTKDDKSRHDKRIGDDRRRDSLGREDKMDRERERERDTDRERKEKSRREIEEQRRVIEATLKQKENDEKARQKMKDEEERKKALKEKEDEKRREKEREIKKIEDEKTRKEREIKSKEERRNELERRRRKELQLKKTMPPMLIGDSPLDKIAAEMDGKELRKENEYETATRASSRVMEISSGVARNRPFSLHGSLHSSKSGIFLDKAQKLRDTTDKPPQEVRRPIRPNRIQMAPMKRPPTAMMSDEESEEEGESPPTQKKGKLGDNKIDNILNTLYQ